MTNIGNMVFVASIVLGVIQHMKKGTTYPAELKLKAAGKRTNPKFARTWTQVVHLIF